MLVALVLLVAACGGGSVETSSSQPTSTGAPSTTAGAAPAISLPPGGLPQGPSALTDINNPELPAPLVAPTDIISGGPPPDGIPPIDDPVLISIEEADQWLEEGEPVVLLEFEGVARAYPVQILIWHEIINDTVAGVPVSITYCPLCNSAVSYRREVNGVETTFGTSGRLYASALVMYDRATESLWTHYDGRAVAGVLTGYELDPVPSPLVAWADFKASFPDGQVLDRSATGFDRPYGSNPYTGYDNPAAFPFLFAGSLDERARAMQRVVGVALEGSAVAWTLEAISGEEAKATNAEVGDTPVVILWKAGQASALEAGEIEAGRDVGTVGVFSTTLDGDTLTFEVEGGAFIDQQTGSTWDITGKAVDGELAGKRLERLHHLDTFWFAWSTYQPETELIES
jgi:hypothetical protein